MADKAEQHEITRPIEVIELGGPLVAAVDIVDNVKLDQADPYLVAFEEPHDAENPLCWSTGRKHLVTDVLSSTGFVRIMISTMMAPALPIIAKELHMTSTEAALALSIYLLATAFGPLFIGPLSEVYGRSVILHGSGLWFLLWNIVCGFATTKGVLIAARFLAGFGASAIYALAGGVLGDIWKPEKRGQSLGVYLLIPLLGVAVGPIIGGFIVGRASWRWMFWSTSIFQAAMTFAAFFSFHESYGALILRRRAQRIRRQTGNDGYYTLEERTHGNKSATSVLSTALTRPVRLLLFHPIIQISALFSGFEYGVLYIIVSTFADLWTSQYHESVEISGLHYIACALGEILASQASAFMMDRLYKRRQAQNPIPEARIPLVYPGLFITTVGLLMYGWAAQYRLYWAIVDVGVFITLFGMQLSTMPLTAYVIDAYKDHTSSAMAATQFVKSLTAFLFPLFAPSLYRGLGYGWGNTSIALVSLVLCIPLTFSIWKFGVRLRGRAASTY